MLFFIKTVWLFSRSGKVDEKMFENGNFAVLFIMSKTLDFRRGK